MLAVRSVISVFAIATMMLGSGVVSAQAYPSKSIRILCAEAGSGTDIEARLIAPLLSARLGQQVIVDNRAAPVVVEATAKAAPDGYTMLISGPITWLLPYMQDNVPWDPLRDFAPLTLVARQPSVLATHPSLPVKSVKELIALARARPGELNYARGAPGGPPHISGELFKSMAKLNIVLVSYKGTASAVVGVVGGEVQFMFMSANTVIPHAKTGRLRALAVTSAEPSELAPGLPTVAASGVPGYKSETMHAMLLPAKTPAAIVNRLNEELVRVLHGPELKEKLLGSGVGVVGSTPDELAAAIKAEMASLGKVIKDAGIRVQ
jgi:tripartite-type tricarboxylate transporter receptor subunit TctC